MPLLCLVQSVEMEEGNKGRPWRPLVQGSTERMSRKKSLPINAEILCITDVWQIQREKMQKIKAYEVLLLVAFQEKYWERYLLNVDCLVRVMCMPADWVPSECQSGAGQQTRVAQVKVPNTAQTTVSESSVALTPKSYRLTLPATGNQFSSKAADGFLDPWSAKNRCALLEGAVWLQWLSREASCTQCKFLRITGLDILQWSNFLSQNGSSYQDVAKLPIRSRDQTLILA